ncbi:hypothetical protein ACLKA6_002381 [Drosophila palustris]
MTFTGRKQVARGVKLSAVTRPEERGSVQDTGAVPKRPVVQPQALRPPSVLPRRPPPSQEPESSSPVYVPPQEPNWRNPNARSPLLNERRASGSMRTETINSRDRTYLKLSDGTKFDGEDSMHSVEDFIFRVEFLQRGSIAARGGKRSKDSIFSWPALLDRFRGYQTEHDLMQELLQREQNANEGVDDYIHHMRQLASRFQKPLRDRELVKIIKRGLKESVAKYVYAMDIITVDELRQECIESRRLKTWRRRHEAPIDLLELWPVRSYVARLPFQGAEDILLACGKPDTFSPQCVDCPGNARMSARPTVRRTRPSIHVGPQQNFWRTATRRNDTVTRRILKTRARFRRRRLTRRQVIEAVQRDDNTDPRVFADVEVAGRKSKGLLDTEQPSALVGTRMPGTGRGTRMASAAIRSPMRKLYFEKPDQQQELYLGIDFWRAFEIAPDVLGAPKTSEADPDVSEATVANTDVSYYRDEDDVESDPEMWNLEERQVTQLEAVKREFLQFEKDGLGKTHLLQHRIQLIEGTEPVKDRHYPLSPAKQEIVWAEVDKMLQLGIIEESDSPWSNRTTVVMRPGKQILFRCPIDETHFISSVDLKFAFWQIELEEKSRAYTAFTVPGRPLYQFRHMLFGSVMRHNNYAVSWRYDSDDAKVKRLRLSERSFNHFRRFPNQFKVSQA